MGTPIVFTWNGEAMVPAHPRRADKAYVVGERYPLVIEEQRSGASHNHEFAWLDEAWLSLPEALADLYPSSEHLRKRALIQAGYYNESITDAGSNAAALRVAALVRSLDEFALTIVRGPVVITRRPKSQSRRAMGNKVFQESKAAIMDVVAEMLGTDRASLPAGRAA